VSAETIEDFARMANVELVVIDEETKLRDFRRELQWNAAYRRFAERI
jgi:L-arabinose isomerase